MRLGEPVDLPISEYDIAQAESYLAAGDLASATPLLERLVELAEEYIDAECQSTDKRQYFSWLRTDCRCLRAPGLSSR